ncbi:hypothetical protein T05_2683 [Trichinella murrelli]|uniref:Uncharacterized protein n=1 Tax=Trichinella murrelli TaxID=144512 RepID=A0A0V0SYZ0_9BILA|nr:hypothetical protein T05_2683 [Trichinella murrelli]
MECCCIYSWISLKIRTNTIIRNEVSPWATAYYTNYANSLCSGVT